MLQTTCSANEILEKKKTKGKTENNLCKLKNLRGKQLEIFEFNKQPQPQSLGSRCLGSKYILERYGVVL